MRIKLGVSIADELMKQDVIEIEDHKLEELSEDEIERVIEIKVREWVDRHIAVVWESED